MGTAKIVPEGSGTVEEIELPCIHAAYKAGSYYLVLTADPSDGYEFDRFEWDNLNTYPDREDSRRHLISHRNPFDGDLILGSFEYKDGQTLTSSNLTAYFKRKNTGNPIYDDKGAGGLICADSGEMLYDGDNDH